MVALITSKVDSDHSTKGPSLRWRSERAIKRHSARPRAAALGSAFARSASYRGASLHQYERRSRAGIFFRRDQRGHHHRTVEAALVLRNRTQLFVYLQGQGRAPEADRRGAWCWLCTRGQRAQEW